MKIRRLYNIKEGDPKEKYAIEMMEQSFLKVKNIIGILNL